MNELLNKLNRIREEFIKINALIGSNGSIAITNDGQISLYLTPTGVLDEEKELLKQAIFTDVSTYRNALKQEFKATIAEIDALL